MKLQLIKNQFMIIPFKFMIIPFMRVSLVLMTFFTFFAHKIDAFEMNLNFWSTSNHSITNYYVAEIPQLPLYGPFRVSWGFMQAPTLWIQGQYLDLRKHPLIQGLAWDLDTVPALLRPPLGYKSWLIFEDENGTFINKIPWKKPFSPELMDFDVTSETSDMLLPSKGSRIPIQFRVQVEAISDRLILTSAPHPLVKPQVVFQCDLPFSLHSKPLLSCFNSLEQLASRSNIQWYFNVEWPQPNNTEEKVFINEKDREWKTLFRKYKHRWQTSKSVGKKFKIKAGVTHLEKLNTIRMPLEEWPSKSFLRSPPESNITQILPEQNFFSDGSSYSLYLFPDDQTQDREQILTQNSPNGLFHIQFVPAPSSAKEMKLRKTDFHEIRTGPLSFFRPFQGSLGLSYLQLSTQRGETSSFFNGPQIELLYRSSWMDLIPYVVHDPGLFHPNSNLFVVESEWGLQRPLLSSSSSLKILGAYHQYALVGRNPGSYRLGQLDSFVLGLSHFKRNDSSFFQSFIKLWTSSQPSFAAQLELGYFPHRTSDFRSYVSSFISVSRYASQLETKNKIFETFTEDRIQIGIKWGFLGPDL